MLQKTKKVCVKTSNPERFSLPVLTKRSIWKFAFCPGSNTDSEDLNEILNYLNQISLKRERERPGGDTKLYLTARHQFWCSMECRVTPFIVITPISTLISNGSTCYDPIDVSNR